METVDVIFDEDRTRELYEQYFRFERRRVFKKFPSGIMYGFFAGLILVGVFSGIDLFWILGTISALLISIILFYYFIRFQLAFNKFSKELEVKAKTADKYFQFAFDSVSLVYKSENMSYEIKWKMIKDYDLNGEDLYLFLENRELFDIISERIMGKEKFERFKEVMIGQVEQVPNKRLSP